MSETSQDQQKNIIIALPPQESTPSALESTQATSMIDSKMAEEHTPYDHHHHHGHEHHHHHHHHDGNNKMEEEDPEGEEGQEKKKKRNKFHFADKVIVDGKTVLEISEDKVFYEEQKVRRNTRWADPKPRKKFDHSDIHFDPIKALFGPKQLSLPAIMMKGASPVVTKPPEPVERPTKWGKEAEKTFNPPPFHGIARGISLNDVEYLMRLYRLDELVKKKNLGQLDISDRDVRSPSPEPIYDKEGKRLNTTEQRMKDEMISEIQTLIDECQSMNPKFVPPHEFRNMKKSRKIYLPESTDGHNNFAGLILGHGGENQKRIETKSNCKISLRGRQAYMRRQDFDPEEQTHVLIQADTDEQLENGVRMIQNLLKGEPDDITEDEKAEKYQLMALSSALDKFCTICHSEGHRAWECPYRKTFKKPLVKCRICGDSSHPTSDCPFKRIGTKDESIEAQKELIDFINKVENTIKDEPMPSDPLSRMNFITNWNGDMLRLKNSASNPEMQPSAEQSEVETIYGSGSGSQFKKPYRGLPAITNGEKGTQPK